MLKLAREVQTSEAWASYLQFAQIAQLLNLIEEIVVVGLVLQS